MPRKNRSPLSILELGIAQIGIYDNEETNPLIRIEAITMAINLESAKHEHQNQN